MQTGDIYTTLRCNVYTSTTFLTSDHTHCFHELLIVENHMHVYSLADIVLKLLVKMVALLTHDYCNLQ